jgi:hypothetical protein
MQTFQVRYTFTYYNIPRSYMFNVQGTWSQVRACSDHIFVGMLKKDFPGYTWLHDYATDTASNRAVIEEKFNLCRTMIDLSAVPTFKASDIEREKVVTVKVTETVVEPARIVVFRDAH